MQITSKKCGVCLQTKKLDNFYKNGYSKTKKVLYKPYCKLCYSKGNKHVLEKTKQKNWTFRNTAALFKLKKQTPKWANKKYILLFYKIAEEEAKRIGQKVNIDHIVPINSPLVCGLHNEFNLDFITFKDNLRKSNNWWPNMPAYTYEDIQEILS